MRRLHESDVRGERGKPGLPKVRGAGRAVGPLPGQAECLHAVGGLGEDPGDSGWTEQLQAAGRPVVFRTHLLHSGGMGCKDVAESLLKSRAYRK